MTNHINIDLSDAISDLTTLQLIKLSLQYNNQSELFHKINQLIAETKSNIDREQSLLESKLVNISQSPLSNQTEISCLTYDIIQQSSRILNLNDLLAQYQKLATIVYDNVYNKFELNTTIQHSQKLYQFNVKS